MGIDPPDISRAEQHYEVIEEAWPAVELFLRVQTQWRVGASGVIGLDYLALKWMIELMGHDDPVGVLEDVQVMEAKILEISNTRANG